jgi:hypothetical protein
MPESVGLYPVKLRVERPGLVGAPVLTLDLLVYAPMGQVHGSGEITQALPPPYGQTHIPQITGVIHHTGFGHDEMLVSLTGQYVVSVPPPAIGSYLAHFSAALVVDDSWTGRGSFTYSGHTIANANVTKIS